MMTIDELSEYIKLVSKKIAQAIRIAQLPVIKTYFEAIEIIADAIIENDLDSLEEIKQVISEIE